MISLRDGYVPDDQTPQDKIKKLVQSLLMGGKKFTLGSYHEGLSPSQIEMIISHLMYTENLSRITITINKESDNYHLGLGIHTLD